jgi:chromosome partitioning protein
VRTVAVVNQKGGSAKTTTVVSVAGALAERGLSVLVIDLDPQGSASDWLASRTNHRGLFDAFLGRRDLASIVVRTAIPGIDLVQASPWLVTAEQTFLGEIGARAALAMEKLPRRWAFVLIDCPPSLSYLSVGALTAVREVIVPVEAHQIALPGVAGVVREIDRLRDDLNPRLSAPIVLPCRVSRTVHARLVIAELQQRYADVLSETTVRESIRVPEAAAAHAPITTFAPASAPSADYRQFADELINRHRQAAGPRGLVSRWRQLIAR